MSGAKNHMIEGENKGMLYFLKLKDKSNMVGSLKLASNNDLQSYLVELIRYHKIDHYVRVYQIKSLRFIC